MKAAIADSSALIALITPNDSLHEKAVTISRHLKDADIPILLPAEVLSETLNLLGKKQGRVKALAVGKHILSDPSIHLADLDFGRFEIALSKWKNQPSGVSYTDCLVMAAADETEKKAGEKPTIFGFDEVFSKNGYSLPIS